MALQPQYFWPSIDPMRPNVAYFSVLKLIKAYPTRESFANANANRMFKLSK